MKKIRYAEMKNDPRYLNINVNGNKKLKNSDKIRFMIWNLPAEKTCPFSTEMCRKSCYAKKAERVYPQCLASREKNLTDSMSDNFVENMIYTIETELSTNKYKNKHVVFRIHESGDFYNLIYALKWIEIAKYFENRANITFLAYTKSIVFFAYSGYDTPDFPQNFVVRSSLWKDTAFDKLEMTYRYHFPIYTALSEKDMQIAKENGRKFYKCECIDCSNCRMCWNRTLNEIICEIH